MAPLSMGFPRQEYWSGLPIPSPGNLPDLGIEPAYLALAGGFFTTEPPGKPIQGFNEDYSPGDSSEKLLQKNSGGASIYMNYLVRKYM